MNRIKAQLGTHWLSLLVLCLVAGSAWVFIELADEVLEGGTRSFDEQVLLAMRSKDDVSDPIGPGWFEEMGRDFTALGGIAVLTMITLAAAGYLLLEHKRRAALLVVLAVGGGTLLSFLLKHGFDRPRPDLVPHESIVYSASFPSGHSMMSALTYLTLAALLAQFQPRHRAKIYLIGLAIMLTILVGVSRVYLGVHWPTDVLAGWSAGAFWALLCWLVAAWLKQRGSVEQEGVEPELEEGTRRRQSSPPAAGQSPEK